MYMISFKPALAILRALSLLSLGCSSSRVSQAEKGVHDEQCRVQRDTCDSICNQQPDTEQAGCKAKCDSDYYSCGNSGP